VTTPENRRARIVLRLIWRRQTVVRREYAKARYEEMRHFWD
jgi:hypothetical protein